MELEIVTPEKIIFQGEVEEIYITTADGEIGVLPHHINLFSKVVPGELKLKIKGHVEYMAITSGFLQVSNNKVTILADYAVPAEKINLEKALEAQKRAEELLKKKESQLSEQEFAAAQATFQQALIEVKVAHRNRSSRVFHN